MLSLWIAAAALLRNDNDGQDDNLPEALVTNPNVPQDEPLEPSPCVLQEMPHFLQSVHSYIVVLDSGSCFAVFSR